MLDPKEYFDKLLDQYWNQESNMRLDQALEFMLIDLQNTIDALERIYKIASGHDIYLWNEISLYEEVKEHIKQL